MFSCERASAQQLGKRASASLTEAPPEIRCADSALRAIDEPILGMRKGLVQPVEDEDVHVFWGVERVRPKCGRGDYVGEGIEGMRIGSRREAVF